MARWAGISVLCCLAVFGCGTSEDSLEIGSTMRAFEDQCHPDPQIDEFKRVRTSVIDSRTVVMKRTPEREETDCWGTFRFEGDRLQSITQP